jgi:integrase
VVNENKKDEKKKSASKKQKEVKLIVDYDADGQAIRKSFYDPTSKKKARDKGLEYIRKLKSGLLVDENTTFEQWSLTWLNTYVTDVSETTRKDTYENTVKKHLNPYFGSNKICAIKPVDIQKFFNSKKGMSFSGLHKCDFILRAIFAQAVNNDIISKTPYRDIRIPSGKASKERKAYTKDQEQTHLEFCKAHPYGVIAALPLKTSASRSEVAALMKNDFNKKENEIHICKGMNRLMEVGPGKTKHRKRFVPYDQEFAELLKHYKAPKGLYMFADENGNPIGPDKLEDCYEKFRRDLLAAHPEIPCLTYHELRHTYATLLNESGVPDNTIALLMGHGKDSKITNEVYIHQNMNHIKEVLKLKNSRTSVVQNGTNIEK